MAEPSLVIDRPTLGRIPGEPYAFTVRSRSKPNACYRVDWWVMADGSLGSECECEAYQFIARWWHSAPQCGQGGAGNRCWHRDEVEAFLEQTKEFQEMTAETRGLRAVTPADEGPRNIDEALAAIYHEVGYVQKTPNRNLGYSYAGEADIIEHLRPAMVLHGVTARVVTYRDVRHEVLLVGKNDSKMQRTTLIATVRFTHGPSGTFVDCEALGEGMDSGDKSANKAMTGALKYALRQTFVLETGTDPDDARPEHGHEDAPQSRQNGQQRAKEPVTSNDLGENWKALPALMQRHGLTSRELAPVLGGKFSQAALGEYLADPEHTLGTLISAAGPREGA